MENNNDHLSRQVQKLKLHRNVSILLLLIMATIFAITSNVLYKHISASTMVSVVEQNLPESGKIRSVVYMPYEAARAQEALISAKEGDSEVIQAARVASVPKGGSLIINFNTKKSGIVETESWNFVVADTSGKVLYSRRGLPCISGAGEKGEMVSYDALLIPVKVPEIFLVKIISRTTNMQNVYQIQTSSPSIGSLYR